jgi:FAD/FMN-containing dehydrogenase
VTTKDGAGTKEGAVQMSTWQNWAGNVQAWPTSSIHPTSEAEIISLVRQAAYKKEPIRVAGSGHSFTPLCVTNGTLITLDGLQGLIAVDQATQTARIYAGTQISQLGEPLLQAGLALTNQGDIDYQALAGAISTGTHGTGVKYGSFSAMVTALHMVLPSGEILFCSAEVEPEIFKAAQLGLGTLGVLTEIVLQVVPAYRLHARTWVASFEETISQLEHHVQKHEHFEFFWLPHYDSSVMKSLTPTNDLPFGGGVASAPPGTLERYCIPERVDWSYRIYPSERQVPFVEMEYAVPSTSGPECFCAIRDLMLSRYPQVTWPVEYRTQRADDIFLSPAFGRDVVTISLHEAPNRPYDTFFRDAEAIFRSFDGRPHWGKLHNLRVSDFEQLYPEWARFQAVREQLDPSGLFLNPYLRTILVEG